MIVQCDLCGDPLNPAVQTIWRRVTGWERKASSVTRRGGSDIVLREPLEQVACGACIDRLRRGVAPAQERLV